MSGLGYVDLYLLHSPYGGAEKRRECWRAVVDAVGEGEVRVGGVSNFGVRHVSFPLYFIFSGSFWGFRCGGSCVGVIWCVRKGWMEGEREGR